MSACAGTGPLGAPVKFQRSERGVTVGSISPSVLSAQYRAVFKRSAVSGSTSTGCPSAWLMF